MTKNKRIYLDHSATTPVKKEVLKAMEPYFSCIYGNASSIHSFGQEARTGVETSRAKIAEILNCEPSEIIFTSGGSESDNLAIRGLVERIKFQGEREKPHIITTAFEHHAVLRTVEELEKEGKIEATYILPDKEGIVSTNDIADAIKENTLLVSVIYVNNEIGTVQPIREIGKLIEKINASRHSELGSESTKEIPKQVRDDKGGLRDDNKGRIYFHTDAVQAAEYFNLDTKYLHVDLMTLSAHKIYGPKGIGLLFAKSGTKLKEQITGGAQEFKIRAGTENVPAIVGFAKALEMTQDACHPGLSEIRHASEIPRGTRNDKKVGSDIMALRDKLIEGILEKIPKSRLNGSKELRSPANANISFYGAEGESILINLDLVGIAASSGSACTSGALEPSHVLTAIGCEPEWSHGSIRFTLGESNTEADVDYTIEELAKIVEKLRLMSPIK